MARYKFYIVLYCIVLYCIVNINKKIPFIICRISTYCNVFCFSSICVWDSAAAVTDDCDVELVELSGRS